MNTRSKGIRQTRRKTKEDIEKRKRQLNIRKKTLDKSFISLPDNLKKIKRGRPLKLKHNQLYQNSKFSQQENKHDNSLLSNQKMSYTDYNVSVMQNSLETNLNETKNKIIANNESTLKNSNFCVRASLLENIDKMNTYDSVFPLTENTDLSSALDSEIGKKGMEPQSKTHNHTDLNSSDECYNDFEFFEIQQSNVMQRMDSPLSGLSDSSTFCDKPPKYKQYNVNITHQSVCNTSRNNKNRFQRHSSGSSLSSGMSDFSMKTQTQSSPNINKWMRLKANQLSDITHNDTQLKESEKKACLPLFLTGTDHVPFPSEAETAPHSPESEVFLGGVVSKIQRKFAEEKSTVSCHWLTPEDFHVKTFSVVKQNIQEKFECHDIKCENFSVVNESENKNICSKNDCQTADVNSSLHSSKKTKKTRKSQIALLHDSLKEIAWAKDLNPECMLTKERVRHDDKLKASTVKKKILENEKSPRKQSPRQSPKISKINNSPSKLLPLVSKSNVQRVLFPNKRTNKENKGSSSLQQTETKVSKLKSKQIVKKYIGKKTESSSPIRKYLVSSGNKVVSDNRKNVQLSPLSQGKTNSSNINKKDNSNLLLKNNCQTVVKKSKQVIVKLPSFKHSKHKNLTKSITAHNQNLCNTQTKPNHKKTTNCCTELRVALEPLEKTCLWETKGKYGQSPSKAYKLTSTKGEQRSKSHHKVKTTWNQITVQKQLYSNNIGSNFFSSFQESSNSISTLKSSKRKRYEEETVRYSIRQSECAFRYKEIAVKKHQNFIQIILVPNRSRHNSLTVEGMKEMKEALLSAYRDVNCRAVLFNSSGSIFCSGVDLTFLLGSGRKHAAEETANAIKDLVQTMGWFPKPLVAAVNGVTIGFGVTLLTFCDVVLASDKATFFMPYAKLGYIAEGAATLTLPQVIGATMATDMLLRGRKLTAQQALRCGLVSEVLWPTQLMEEAIPRINALAAQSLPVMEATKSMIRCHLWEKLQSTLENESRSLPKQWTSSTCQQAIRRAVDSGIFTE